VVANTESLVRLSCPVGGAAAVVAAKVVTCLYKMDSTKDDSIAGFAKFVGALGLIIHLWQKRRHVYRWHLQECTYLQALVQSPNGSELKGTGYPGTVTSYLAANTR
jgi:hypothetical protein